VELLKKMKQHPNFKLNDTNLQHFKDNAQKANQNYSDSYYLKESEKIAKEVGDLLGK
jgi:hypothetical protein